MTHLLTAAIGDLGAVNGHMLANLAIVAAGIAVRQADRWWFSPARGLPPLLTLQAVMQLQRARVNDLTPALLVAGHWLELIGWWALAAQGGPFGWPVAALAAAVKFRHLQEVTHFAVHGVLTRSGTVGAMLAEAAVHAPLGFVPVPARRDKHVRRHHPNATVAGVDPNLAELEQAGLRAGTGCLRFARGVMFPLTLAGVADTVRGLVTGLRPGTASPWWRVGVFTAVLAVAALIGWPALVFGYAIPRLLLYPQLAWLSLLVEHRWFDPEAAAEPAASRVEVEAARCLRLYPHNPVLALLARATWLPYGDLYHYAHSTHPSVRWNYLPTVERILIEPTCTPRGLLFGRSAVIGHHRRALTTSM